MPKEKTKPLQMATPPKGDGFKERGSAIFWLIVFVLLIPVLCSLVYFLS